MMTRKFNKQEIHTYPCELSKLVSTANCILISSYTERAMSMVSGYLCMHRHLAFERRHRGVRIHMN
jgi:hypothetical protein